MSLLSIIDYGSGNLRSVYNAVKKILSTKSLCSKVIVTNDTKELNRSSHFILPGVGSFKGCLKGFHSNPGLVDCLSENVLIKQKPFLGICVGMQMLADKGFEDGESDGLGWIEGEIRQLKTNNRSYKIPHIGWNNLMLKNNHPFIDFWRSKSNLAFDNDLNAYFVHSFSFKSKKSKFEILKSNYGGDFTAMVGKDNILGTQFHPEKSQKVGLNFLNAFINWEQTK